MHLMHRADIRSITLIVVAMGLAGCGDGNHAAPTNFPDQPSPNASSPATATRSEAYPGASTWPVGGAPLSPSATAGSATAASADPVPGAH